MPRGSNNRMPAGVKRRYFELIRSGLSGSDASQRVGVSLSDEHQLHPEQSTSALVLLNPRAKYFSV